MQLREAIQKSVTNITLLFDPTPQTLVKIFRTQKITNWLIIGVPPIFHLNFFLKWLKMAWNGNICYTLFLKAYTDCFIQLFEDIKGQEPADLYWWAKC